MTTTPADWSDALHSRAKDQPSERDHLDELADSLPCDEPAPPADLPHPAEWETAIGYAWYALGTTLDAVAVAARMATETGDTEEALRLALAHSHLVRADQARTVGIPEPAQAPVVPLRTFYVTFGQQYPREPHPTFGGAHRDGVVVLRAISMDEARTRAVNVLGTAWSGIYEEGDQAWAPHMYPLGVILDLDAEDSERDPAQDAEDHAREMFDRRRAEAKGGER
jgi:hypothetical protein